MKKIYIKYYKYIIKKNLGYSFKEYFINTVDFKMKEGPD